MLPPEPHRTPAILDTAGHRRRRAWPALSPALVRAGLGPVSSSLPGCTDKLFDTGPSVRRRYDDVLTGFGPAPAEETAAGLA